jgi:hypothetical protein
MTTTINGRTPEEIKLGLEIVNEHCFKVECSSSACPYYKECAPRTNMMREVPAQLVRDNIALINQLQEDKKQLEAERDAAVEGLTIIANNTGSCIMCKHRIHPGYVCDRFEREENCYEWRGI